MTKEFLVNLSDFDKLKTFANDMFTVEGDVTVSNGRYVVDGKSIMGLCSLDNRKSLKVTYSGFDNEDCQKFIALIAPYEA